MDLRISELPVLQPGDAEANDDLAVADYSSSETRRLTLKGGVQQAVSSLIDDGSIPGAKLVSDSVTAQQLAPDSVGVSELADGAVDTAALQDGSVTDGKVAPGLNGSKLADDTVTAAKVPAASLDRGLDKSTGAIGHTNAVTAGTRSGISYDAEGHITSTAPLAPSDLPLATAATAGAVSVPASSGLQVSPTGVLDHLSSITADTVSGISYDEHGHIVGAMPLAGADLPVATETTIGGVSVPQGDALSVDAAGALSHADSTVVPGTYPKVTVDQNGHVTAGSALAAGDIPEIPAEKIASGTLPADRIGANSITAQMLADYAIAYIQEGQPTDVDPGSIGMLWLQESTAQLRMWNGNSWFAVGLGRLVQENLRFGGLVDATTGLITIATQFGVNSGLSVGSPVPNATDRLGGLYVVAQIGGSGIGQTPGVNYDEGDWCLCVDQANGWVRIDTLSGGGGGVQYLDDLLDVTLSAPQGNQVLTYNGISGLWENKTLPAAPVSSVHGRTGAVVAAEGDYSLDLLGDVTLAAPVLNDVLRFNGTAWVNTPLGTATETAAGIAEIATQAETDAGVDDVRIVTPLKLRTYVSQSLYWAKNGTELEPRTAGDVVPSEHVSFLQDGASAVARTVESKLSDVVSVKDFGAVGDGVADDTAALCAAMDYCRVNQRTLWLDGTYKVVAASLPAGNNYASALAAGPERATLSLQGDISFLVSQGFSLENINILTTHTYPNSTAAYEYLFSSEGQRLTDIIVRNVRYVQAAVTDGSARGKGLLLLKAGATRFSAYNVTVENVREGFVFETNSDAETTSLIDGAFFDFRCYNVQRGLVFNAATSNPHGNTGIVIDSLRGVNTLQQANAYSGGARTGHSFIVGDLGQNAVIDNCYVERPIEHAIYVYGKELSISNFCGINSSDISIAGYSVANPSSGSIFISSSRMTEAPLLAFSTALVTLRYCENVVVNVAHFKGTNTVDAGTGALIRPSHVVDLSRYAKNVHVTAAGQYLLRGVVAYDTTASMEQAYEGITITGCNILDPTSNQTVDFDAAINRLTADTPGWWTPGSPFIKQVKIVSNYFGVTSETAGAPETLTLIGRNRVGSSKTKGLVSIDLASGVTIKDSRIDGFYGDSAAGAMYPFTVSNSSDVIIDTTCSGAGPGNVYRVVYYAPSLSAGSRLDTIAAPFGSFLSSDVELVWAEDGAANESALLDATSMLRLAAGATENDVVYYANFVGIATLNTSDGEYANLAVTPSSISIMSSSTGFALTNTAGKVCLVSSGPFAAVVNNKGATLDVVVTQRGRFKL